MIDRVIDIKTGEKIVALKNVSGNESFFQGHFPDDAVMPGALILEAMAQAAIILFSYGNHDKDNADKLFLFGKVKGRFLNPVYPGDQILITITPIKMISTGGIVEGEAKVDDRIVCKGELGFSVKEK
jgi:3-hydroxyacyl-[acyl-carrier-protein] dehydratase